MVAILPADARHATFKGMQVTLDINAHGRSIRKRQEFYRSEVGITSPERDRRSGCPLVPPTPRYVWSTRSATAPPSTTTSPDCAMTNEPTAALNYGYHLNVASDPTKAEPEKVPSDRQ